MNQEKIIKDAIHYIRTHMPQETDFKTIDVAISTVAKGCNAATQGDLLKDDQWLVSYDERQEFVGMRGRGWTSLFDKETIRMFKEAVQYARTHASEYEKTGGVAIDSDNIKKLKKMRNELMNNIPYDNNYSNIDNKKTPEDIDYDKYMPDYNDINKIVK